MLPPGILPSLEIRYVSNGTLASSPAVADRYVPAGGGLPLRGPAASDEWVVVSLRPYARMRSEFCSVWDSPLGCVNELSAFHLPDGAIFPITHSLDLFLTTPGAILWAELCMFEFTWEGFPSLSGSVVYWQDNRNSRFILSDDDGTCTWSGNQWDVYSFDLSTGTETAILTNPWNETHPNADKGFLVWSDDRNGNWDVYAMELDTGEEYRLTESPADQRNPVISQGCVAWEDNRNGDWDIYGRCLFEPTWTPDRKVSREDGDSGVSLEVSWSGNRTMARNLTKPPGEGPRSAPAVAAPVRDGSESAVARLTLAQIVPPPRRTPPPPAWRSHGALL